MENPDSPAPAVRATRRVHRPRAHRRGPRGVRLTERDVELLRFLAEQQVVHAAHISELLRVSASAARSRLRRLTQAGYLDSDRPFDRAPAWYLATTKGLRTVGRTYRRSQFDPLTYQHNLGLGWLDLAARRGVWGELREIVSERAMRSADARTEREAGELFDPRRELFGVRLGTWGEGGKEGRHYPDLLLITPEGRRIAIELELTQKPRTRLEKIMGGYTLEQRIDAVVYLVEDQGAGPSIGRAVERAAAAHGISDMVHVQRFQRSDAAADRAGRERLAQRSRTTARPEPERAAER